MAQSASTQKSTKRPLTPAQLANLAKGNPRVAERHARGQYDSRIVSEEDLKALADNPQHDEILELLHDYQDALRQRDERIDRLERRIEILKGGDDVDGHDDDHTPTPDGDPAPHGHCPTCDQPLAKPLDDDDEDDDADPDDEPRRGPLGEFWAGLTQGSPYDDDPGDHTI